MAIQTLTVKGERFVVIPEREYRILKKRHATVATGSKSRKRPTRQEEGDLAEIQRLRADPSQKPLPLAQARKRLA